MRKKLLIDNTKSKTHKEKKIHKQEFINVTSALQKIPLKK